MGSTEQALDFLRRAPLDHGLCCEIADAETGESVSGRGYAACAGYLAYAMAVALTWNTRAGLSPRPEPAHTLDRQRTKEPDSMLRDDCPKILCFYVKPAVNLSVLNSVL